MDLLEKKFQKLLILFSDVLNESVDYHTNYYESEIREIMEREVNE